MQLVAPTGATTSFHCWQHRRGVDIMGRILAFTTLFSRLVWIAVGGPRTTQYDPPFLPIVCPASAGGSIVSLQEHANNSNGGWYILGCYHLRDVQF